MAKALLMVLLAQIIKKRVLKSGVCLRARRSGRLQTKSRRQRPGKTRFSVKALRIGKRAVASYDYVVVAVHEGKLIFCEWGVCCLYTGSRNVVIMVELNDAADLEHSDTTARLSRKLYSQAQGTQLAP